MHQGTAYSSGALFIVGASADASSGPEPRQRELDGLEWLGSNSLASFSVCSKALPRAARTRTAMLAASSPKISRMARWQRTQILKRS